MSEILHVYTRNLKINILFILKKDVLEIHMYTAYKTFVF